MNGGVFNDLDNFSYSLIENSYAYDDTVFNNTELMSSNFVDNIINENGLNLFIVLF